MSIIENAAAEKAMFDKTAQAGYAGITFSAATVGFLSANQQTTGYN